VCAQRPLAFCCREHAIDRCPTDTQRRGNRPCRLTARVHSLRRDGKSTREIASLLAAEGHPLPNSAR
jgi:hypothetical protein